MVNSFNLEENRVSTAGPVRASAETMSHGAVYRSCPAASCVIHIHSRKIFDAMLRDKYPATPLEAAYGTPEMARAIAACVREQSGAQGVIALAGHDEGVLAYGVTVKEALDLIIALNQRPEGCCSVRYGFYEL
jgi:ribulose-5-phosphate 4-epimerase/fuculose-1-phosphate aldolase